jgi:hypothetical protein
MLICLPLTRNSGVSMSGLFIRILMYITPMSVVHYKIKQEPEPGLVVSEHASTPAQPTPSMGTCRGLHIRR